MKLANLAGVRAWAEQDTDGFGLAARAAASSSAADRHSSWAPLKPLGPRKYFPAARVFAKRSQPRSMRRWKCSCAKGGRMISKPARRTLLSSGLALAAVGAFRGSRWHAAAAGLHGHQPRRRRFRRIARDPQPAVRLSLRRQHRLLRGTCLQPHSPPVQMGKARAQDRRAVRAQGAAAAQGVRRLRHGKASMSSSIRTTMRNGVFWRTIGRPDISSARHRCPPPLSRASGLVSRNPSWATNTLHSGS